VDVAVRIVVVDDTDHVRTMLVDMLRLDGFDVVGEADDGATAVDVIVDTDPHVVVMDMRMRTVGGLEASRRVRAVRPHQRIVLYTAYLDAKIEEEARAAGVTVCLGKNAGLQELERHLARLTLELAP
jgi:DNA-binding NarL/FixJ family response regulator